MQLERSRKLYETKDGTVEQYHSVFTMLQGFHKLKREKLTGVAIQDGWKTTLPYGLLIFM
jgi:hypothetical protein